MRPLTIIVAVLLCLLCLVPLLILYARSESWLDVLMPRFE